jgi:DNA-binding GntR family transcriptional regulator
MARPPAVLRPWASADEPPEGSGQTQADIAYRLVKMAILDGGLPPGYRASEQQIALRLSMSRTPVHQAVVRLQQEQWLELSPRRGVEIATIDSGDMREVYETLMALEGAAVAKLAARPPDVDDEIDASLRVAGDECVSALDADDLRGWAEADHRFHTLLLTTSGNTRLARLAQSVTEQAHRARLVTVGLRPRPTASNADHDAIIRAIVEREPVTAREALERHRRRGIETLLPILEALTPPPSPFSAP